MTAHQYVDRYKASLSANGTASNGNSSAETGAVTSGEKSAEKESANV
jgi:hypothetical protein